MATGYGRKAIGFAHADMTEISAHAAGVHRDFPRPVTVVDVGGQDCKVIRLDAEGRVTSFRMNRKCAAGTGAFLEESARRLGTGDDLGKLSGMARRSGHAVELGSFCTVFTQTEMLDLIRRGTDPSDLARGLFVSVVKRIQEMDALAGEVVLTGGVAEHQPVLQDVMAGRIAGPVSIAPRPQLTGALGAALTALKRRGQPLP
jgi:predicted CoA-substrate-specific enzyme activase